MFCLYVPQEPDVSIQKQIESVTNNPNVQVTCQVKIYWDDDYEVMINDRIVNDKKDINNDMMLSSAEYNKNNNMNPKKVAWLQALDQYGQPKTSGGDEFYITYHQCNNHSREAQEEEEGNASSGEQNNCNDPSKNHPTCVALIEDMMDGKYRLTFTTPPLQLNVYHNAMEESSVSHCFHDDVNKETAVVGQLTVHFEYSCGLGQLPPPKKKDWINGAYVHKTYVINKVHTPPMNVFVPPPVPPLHISATTTIPCYLDQYDIVIGFGDSTMEQFFRQRPNKKGKYFFQHNLVFGEKVRIGLNTQTVQELLQDLHNQHGDILLRKTQNQNQKKVALLLGSCLWDILDWQDTIQGMDYNDHQKACETFIRSIQQKYLQVDCIWKSPMAVHIHWVDLDRLYNHDNAATLFGVERVRYMSRSRSENIYRYQKSIMKKLNVPFLDIYQATYLSANMLFPSDGRHYRPDLNRLMLSWFYKSIAKQKYFISDISAAIQESKDKDVEKRNK